MWPILLDMTKEECLQHLRCLEIDAFSTLVNALRAQGTLSNAKLKLLQETGAMLQISQERHKAEIRRVVNDERLSTIAYHVNDQRHLPDEWKNEGKRLMPLIPRMAPQTAYSAIADEVADSASVLNRQLPLPASTERKRPLSPPIVHAIASTSETSKSSVRPPEPDAKKRKHASLLVENCVPALHPMGPPKLSKIQQIYRQKSENRLKEQLGKLKEFEIDEVEVPAISPGGYQSPKTPKAPILPNSPKFNIIQNVCTKSITSDKGHLNMEQLGHGRTSRPSSKTITTADGQKLVVVSTMSPTSTKQSPATNILQRSLTTIRNLDKFKIMSPTGAATSSKIVGMRTPSKGAQVQVVNTKTGIRVVPIGNKLVNMDTTKSTCSVPMPKVCSRTTRTTPKRHSRVLTTFTTTSCDIIDCDADEDGISHTENGDRRTSDSIDNRPNGIINQNIQFLVADGEEANGTEEVQITPIGNHLAANAHDYNSNDSLEHLQGHDDDAESKDYIYTEERMEFDSSLIVYDENQQEVVIDETIAEQQQMETLKLQLSESENVAS